MEEIRHGGTNTWRKLDIEKITNNLNIKKIFNVFVCISYYYYISFFN